jgi:chorismate synthase
VAKRYLSHFGIGVESHVLSIGPVKATQPDTLPESLNEAADASPVRCVDPEAAQGMIDAIEQAQKAGDTLGGVFEVVATGVPVGLGSYASWDGKLDGRLGQALLSIHAVKAAEVGEGVLGAYAPGSQVHDPITPAPELGGGGGFGRASNRAGGLEGGVTTGQPIIVRGYMKPISTLRKPLPSVDLRTGSVASAAVERSDVCAVPAAAVIGETMVALVLADAFAEKFGGDSVAETERNCKAYLAALADRGFGER